MRSLPLREVLRRVFAPKGWVLVEKVSRLWPPLIASLETYDIGKEVSPPAGGEYARWVFRAGGVFQHSMTPPGPSAGQRMGPPSSRRDSFSFSIIVRTSVRAILTSSPQRPPARIPPEAPHPRTLQPAAPPSASAQSTGSPHLSPSCHSASLPSAPGYGSHPAS